MAITTTAPRHTNPPRRSAANDEQEATTHPASKRKAVTANDKITKSQCRMRGNKAQKNDNEHAK